MFNNATLDNLMELKVSDNDLITDETKLDVLRRNDTNWDNSDDWLEGMSWSRVLLSNSENMRQNSTLGRQKDTLLVILIRRLEAFPGQQTITKIRQLFKSELERLSFVKEAMQPSVQFISDITTTKDLSKEQNPILTQTALELESEEKKIAIEQEAFEKKVSSELGILENICSSIFESSPEKKQKVILILQLYGFELIDTNLNFKSL